MSKAAIQAGKVAVAVTVDDSQLRAGGAKVAATLKSLASGINSISNKMLAFGSAMSIPVGMALRQFTEFDHTMRVVQAVTNGTEKEFQQLTDRARQLGKTTSFTSTEIARGMTSLGRMGWKTNEIDSAIASMMDLARATDEDVGIVSQLTSNTMRAFRATSKEARHFADILTITANHSAQTIVDVGEAMTLVGPIASQAGDSVEDLATALAVMANNGVRGSLAGTALRNAYVKLARPSRESAQILKDLNIETSDAFGNMRHLADIMADLYGAMDARNYGSEKRLAVVSELFGLRGMLGASVLTANVDQMAEFRKELEKANGAASKTARTMERGLWGSTKLALSAIQDVALEFGNIVTGDLQTFLEKVMTATREFGSWMKANKETVKTIADIAIEAGKIAIAMKAVSAAFEKIAALKGALAAIGAIGAGGGDGKGLLAAAASNAAFVPFMGGGKKPQPKPKVSLSEAMRAYSSAEKGVEQASIEVVSATEAKEAAIAQKAAADEYAKKMAGVAKAQESSAAIAKKAAKKAAEAQIKAAGAVTGASFEARASQSRLDAFRAKIGVGAGGLQIDGQKAALDSAKAEMDAARALAIEAENAAKAQESIAATAEKAAKKAESAYAKELNRSAAMADAARKAQENAFRMEASQSYRTLYSHEVLGVELGKASRDAERLTAEANTRAFRLFTSSANNYSNVDSAGALAKKLGAESTQARLAATASRADAAAAAQRLAAASANVDSQTKHLAELVAARKQELKLIAEHEKNLAKLAAARGAENAAASAAKPLIAARTAAKTAAEGAAFAAGSAAAEKVVAGKAVDAAEKRLADATAKRAAACVSLASAGNSVGAASGGVAAGSALAVTGIVAGIAADVALIYKDFQLYTKWKSTEIGVTAQLAENDNAAIKLAQRQLEVVKNGGNGDINARKIGDVGAELARLVELDMSYRKQSLSGVGVAERDALLAKYGMKSGDDVYRRSSDILFEQFKQGGSFAYRAIAEAEARAAEARGRGNEEAASALEAIASEIRKTREDMRKAIKDVGHYDMGAFGGRPNISISLPGISEDITTAFGEALKKATPTYQSAFADTVSSLDAFNTAIQKDVAELYKLAGAARTQADAQSILDRDGQLKVMAYKYADMIRTQQFKITHEEQGRRTGTMAGAIREGIQMLSSAGDVNGAKALQGRGISFLEGRLRVLSANLASVHRDNMATAKYQFRSKLTKEENEREAMIRSDIYEIVKALEGLREIDIKDAGVDNGGNASAFGALSFKEFFAGLYNAGDYSAQTAKSNEQIKENTKEQIRLQRYIYNNLRDLSKANNELVYEN